MTRFLAAPADRRTPAVPLAVAVLVLLVTTALAAGGRVLGWEETVFRWGNDTGLPQPLVWPVMQLGNLLAVLAVALVAVAVRRRRLALEVLAAGVAAYVLARVLKALVDRGRPGDLLTDVELRWDDVSGRGFPSGHAAVSAALACVVLPHVAPRWRWAVVVAALLVCLARVHVGAHLPLDVIGGAALGAVCACAALLAGGRGRRGS